VALSGGVDSAVCAHLLREQGHDLIGVTIKTWSSDECRDEKSKGCCLHPRHRRRPLGGRKLDIPYTSWTSQAISRRT